MSRLFQTRWRDRYAEVIKVFANTGEENEQTLAFVDNCDRQFGFNTVWVEVERPGPDARHRIVTFETASRKGEPYAAIVKHYGIPNSSFPHCTRELKLRPITSYARSLGWGPGTYDVAVGIRADESSRRSAAAVKAGIVYPLLDWLPTTKADVNTFWKDQPFRLDLAGYQGNCKWCWKKSTRKLLTVMDETPDAFNFPERMESAYGLVGPEFKKTTAPGYRRVFFRKHMTVADLRAAHAAGGWDRAENDAVIYSGRSIPLDQDDDCVESCEVNFEETV